MKITRAKDMQYVPASHEDPINPGVVKKVLFAGDDITSGTRVQMVNWAMLPVGKSFQAHYHQDMDEMFVVSSGKARVTIDDKESILEMGDAILIAAGEIHAMENISDVDVLYIAVGLTKGTGGKTIVVEKK
jgi:mannose-6-phosphate isomerase-like protein (cupin superfamily)